MSALKEFKILAYEHACHKCPSYKDGICQKTNECVWSYIEEALKDYYKIKEIEEHYHLDDYTKEVKHKKTFAEYLKEYYSKHSLKSDKKKRVIVSDGRVIF